MPVSLLYPFPYCLQIWWWWRWLHKTLRNLLASINILISTPKGGEIVPPPPPCLQLKEVNSRLCNRVSVSIHPLKSHCPNKIRTFSNRVFLTTLFSPMRKKILIFILFRIAVRSTYFLKTPGELPPKFN